MVDMNRVPWLSRDQIARKAEDVLAVSGQRLGMEMAPPIPIEAMIERVFGLHLLVEDLTERYAHLASIDEDLLGATVVPRRQILIHERLLSGPGSPGRYAFTCAHELAHWVLHRHLASEPRALQRRPGPGILCRLSACKERGEWQADYMAACILMPEDRVRKAYREAISERPTLLVNQQSRTCPRGRPLWLEPVLAHAPYYAEAVIETGGFRNVSKQAMRIRLEELGLLVNAVDKPWIASA